jgi:hypothetical protein
MDTSGSVRIDKQLKTDGLKSAFVSGGVAQDTVRLIKGQFAPAYLGNSYNAEPNVPNDGRAGPFSVKARINSGFVTGATSQGSYSDVEFDNSKVVKTGPDNAGANLSKRLWRRVS